MRAINGLLHSYTLAVNTFAQIIVGYMVVTVHTGDIDVTEDSITQKLILISITLYIEDLVAEDAVHRMVLALEEVRIDS